MPRKPPRVSAPVEPTAYGANEMDYNDYLHVPDLLSLQHPLSRPPHHDELLFITIHQAFELWFKQLIHEIETAREALQNAHLARALHALRRCVAVQRLLIDQIHLLETMDPVDFLAFRDHLKPASGFQSLQFREIEFLSGLHDPEYLSFFRHRPAMVKRLRQRLAEPDLRDAYLEAVRAEGLALPHDATDAQALAQALRPVYEHAADHQALHDVSEALLEFDEAFSLWRDHHVRVVERIIGFKRGTGGSTGAGYLRTTLGKRFFPFLWDVRTVLEAT